MQSIQKLAQCHGVVWLNLKEAMLAVVEDKPVEHAVTEPYGCSVKY